MFLSYESERLLPGWRPPAGAFFDDWYSGDSTDNNDTFGGSTVDTSSGATVDTSPTETFYGGTDSSGDPSTAYGGSNDPSQGSTSGSDTYDPFSGFGSPQQSIDLGSYPMGGTQTTSGGFPTGGSTYTSSGGGGGGSTSSTSTTTSGGGTVPVMNTDYEKAKLQAATDAARLAYDYWHTVSGSDQLAFEKAKQAALDTYNQGQIGIEAMKLAASLQGNPFKQQQVLWGIGQNPYLSNAVGAVAGKYELPRFQGSGIGAAGTDTLGNLAGRTGATDTSNSGGTQADLQAAIDAMPVPNQVVARQFYQQDPATQAYLLSGIQAKTGLDPNTIESQIKATLPQFKSPSFGLADGV